MACPQQHRCTLHQQMDGPGALTPWRNLYCDSGFERCVRYRLATIRSPVPADLLPDGRTARIGEAQV